MTYEQNIRVIAKRLDRAHYTWHLQGVQITKQRAQAKEAIELQAEAVRKTIEYLKYNSLDRDNIEDYLFTQGLLPAP